MYGICWYCLYVVMFAIHFVDIMISRKNITFIKRNRKFFHESHSTAPVHHTEQSRMNRKRGRRTLQKILAYLCYQISVNDKFFLNKLKCNNWVLAPLPQSLYLIMMRITSQSQQLKSKKSIIISLFRRIAIMQIIFSCRSFDRFTSFFVYQ